MEHPHQNETAILTAVAERHPHAEEDFFDIVKRLQDVEDRAIAIEREEYAREMAETPEKFMPSQFEQLAKLYRGRSQRDTYHWHNRIEEVTVFGSRSLDDSRLEEVYEIYDEFGPHNKDWQRREYMARMFDDDGREHSLRLDSSGAFTVRTRRADERQWHGVDAETAHQTTARFFTESLRAVAVQLARDEDEQARADDDARQKILTLYHDGRQR